VHRTEIALQILRQRQWQRQIIPIQGSGVAIDVAFYLLTKSPSSVTLVKEIHLALGYSEDRVGVIVKSLSSSGLVQINKQGGDKRTRNVSATDGLNALLDEYIELFKLAQLD